MSVSHPSDAQDASRGGAPIHSNNAAASIGIDLGGSNIYGVAFDSEGRPIAHDKVDTEAKRGYEHVIARIQAQADRLIGEAKDLGYEVSAVGLCVPGVVLSDQGAVRKAPNLGWKDVRPLLDLRLPGRAALLNDVNAGLLGELSRHENPPFCTAAYFCGTGVGGAIHLGGRLITGSTGGAGEVGHAVVKAGGRKTDGGVRGSLESYIGKWALNRKIQKRLERGKKTALKDIIDYDLESTPVKSSSIRKALDQGDRFTRKLMEDYYARYLGVGLSQMVNILEPDLIILGGGIMEAVGSRIADHVEVYMRKHCITSPPRLEIARLGDLAGPAGAAHFARTS